MLSQNNNIYEDIRELLGITDKLSPEMERVLSVMSDQKPHVIMDEEYRQKLKESLIYSRSHISQKIRFSWITPITWMGTSFAAILITLGIIRIFSWTIHTIPTNTIQILTIQSPVLSSMNSWKIIEPESNDTHMRESITTDHQKPITQKTQKNESKNSPASSWTPSVSEAPVSWDRYALLDNTPMAVGGAYPNKVWSTGTPEMDAMAMSMTKRSMDTVSLESFPEVDSEIRDITWDINSVIQWSIWDPIILPEYPIEMSIYIKNQTPFTTDEQSLLVGSGITNHIVSTYSRDILRWIIEKYRASILKNKTPIIHYTSYTQWEQNILVPTLVYETTTWSTIIIPLIPGY